MAKQGRSVFLLRGMRLCIIKRGAASPDVARYGLYYGRYHCHRAPCDESDIAYHRAQGTNLSDIERTVARQRRIYGLLSSS